MTTLVEKAPASATSSRWENARRGFYRFRNSWLSIAGLLIVGALFVIAVIGPSIVPYPEHVAGGVATSARFESPSAMHWFGTNELGQDVFSLVIAGSQISLLAGLAVVIVGALVGTAVGAIAGYFGGWTDEVLMRSVSDPRYGCCRCAGPWHR
jgi:peptide/nickel transport system permease protein